MKLIGLTGSIGMGKSETAKMFMAQNIPVFDSDQAVHDLLGPKGEAVEQVEQKFPGVMRNTQIDRKKLGKIVFGDEKALKNLEQILHPMVSLKRAEFIKNAAANGAEMVVLDVPLLFEKKYDHECDYIVVVSAPFEVQKKRVMARSDMTAEKFQQILDQQMPDEEKRQRADFIVQTDLGFKYAENKVKEIIKEIGKK